MTAALTGNFGFNFLDFLVNLAGGETYFLLTTSHDAARLRSHTQTWLSTALWSVINRQWHHHRRYKWLHNRGGSMREKRRIWNSGKCLPTFRRIVWPSWTVWTTRGGKWAFRTALTIYPKQQCNDQQHLNLQGRKNVGIIFVTKILKVGDSEAIKIKIREGREPRQLQSIFSVTSQTG